MSYTGPSPRIIRHGEQRSTVAALGSTRFAGTGAQTDGDYGLFDAVLAPGADGPGPHYHRTFSESFYVVEGTLLIVTSGGLETVGVGELAYVPRWGVHGFRNGREDAEVRFILLFTPGIPREQYFDELNLLRADDRTPTTAEIDALALRHDQVNLR